MICLRKLLLKYSQKILPAAFFSNENMFKVNQVYSSHSNLVYVPKKMEKVEVPKEKLFFKVLAFLKETLVSVVISKSSKTSIFC